MVSAARCCSSGSGRLGGAAARWRGRRSLDLLISVPRVNLFCHPYAREGQAVVCPLLGGHSPTRCLAPKQHWGLGRAFPLSLGASVPKNLARRKRKTRRLLTNRPCSSLVYEESDSKERLRVSNWIVHRLYNYAVKKTVEL
jgi:hypothetical protein